MKQLFALIVLLTSIGGFGSANAQAPATTLSGWQAVLDAISTTPANKISDLNGRSFNLELGPNATQLKVSPIAPFELTGSQPSYRLKVVNAAALVEDRNGLIVKKPVEWSAIVGDAGRFNLRIEGVDECLFNLTFSQADGGTLDLSALRSAYDVTWTFDNPSAVESADLNGTGLQVRRRNGNNSDVAVTLRLKEKAGTIDVSSKPIPIQKCGRFVRDGNGSTGILQIRTPPQCVILSRPKEDAFNGGGYRGINYDLTYTNTCDRPVQCDLTFRYYRYGSVSDGIARVNSTQITFYRQTVLITGNGDFSLKFFLQTELLNEPYYSWTKPHLADLTSPGYRDPDFVCGWF